MWIIVYGIFRKITLDCKQATVEQLKSICLYCHKPNSENDLKVIFLRVISKIVKKETFHRVTLKYVINFNFTLSFHRVTL